MNEEIAQLRQLAKDCDMMIAPDGSKVTLVYNAFAIFKGSIKGAILYMSGWRDALLSSSERPSLVDQCSDCGTIGMHHCLGVPGGFGDNE